MADTIRGIRKKDNGFRGEIDQTGPNPPDLDSIGAGAGAGAGSDTPQQGAAETNSTAKIEEKIDLTVLPKTRKPRGKSHKPQTLSIDPTTLVFILNSVAVTVGGPGAAMLPHEQDLIITPMVRTAGRLSPELIDTINTWIDPLTILLGFSFWGLRLMTIQQEQRKTMLTGSPPDMVVSNGEVTDNPLGTVPPEIAGSINGTI